MGSLRSSEKDRLVVKLSFSLGGGQQPLSPGSAEAGPTTIHEWRYEPGVEQEPEPAPRTYYEALTGRPDPAAARLVKVGRAIHLLVTLLAIGLPIGLTLLMIALGEPLETIVFFAIGASIVGLMLKSTFPRTPFD
jgi:hypothetical protein